MEDMHPAALLRAALLLVGLTLLVVGCLPTRLAVVATHDHNAGTHGRTP